MALFVGTTSDSRIFHDSQFLRSVFGWKVLPNIWTEIQQIECKAWSCSIKSISKLIKTLIPTISMRSGQVLGSIISDERIEIPQSKDLKFVMFGSIEFWSNFDWLVISFLCHCGMTIIGILISGLRSTMMWPTRNLGLKPPSKLVNISLPYSDSWRWNKSSPISPLVGLYCELAFSQMVPWSSHVRCLISVMTRTWSPRVAKCLGLLNDKGVARILESMGMG